MTIAPDTQILTAGGMKAVEDLVAEDILLPSGTRANEPQAVLGNLREISAAASLENHNFQPWLVTDQDGWTRDGIYWSKRIYGDTDDGKRFCASFGVEFDGKESAVVADGWCETLNTHRP